MSKIKRKIKKFKSKVLNGGKVIDYGLNEDASCDAGYESFTMPPLNMDNANLFWDAPFVSPKFKCGTHGAHESTMRLDFAPPNDALNGYYCMICIGERWVKDLPKIEEMK